MLKDKCKAFLGKCRSAVKKSLDKVAMMAAVPITAITAETTTTPVDTTSLVESIKGLFSDFSVSNLVIIIGAALGIGVTLFLFWFAYRFIKRQAVKGITKGKL